VSTEVLVGQPESTLSVIMVGGSAAVAPAALPRSGIHVQRAERGFEAGGDRRL